MSERREHPAPDPRPAPRIPRLVWGLAAVLVAVVVLSLGTWRLRSDRDRLRAELDFRGIAWNRERSALLDSLAAADDLIALLGDPGAGCYEFRTTPDTPAGLAARLVLDRDSRRAYVALEHAVIPDGVDLELWAMRDGAPASLGVIARNGDRAGLLVDDVGPLGSLETLAVSIEPPVGSPQAGPTGPVILVRSF